MLSVYFTQIPSINNFYILSVVENTIDQSIGEFQFWKLENTIENFLAVLHYDVMNLSLPANLLNYHLMWQTPRTYR